jgi:hypothetical protein
MLKNRNVTPVKKMTKIALFVALVVFVYGGRFTRDLTE